MNVILSDKEGIFSQEVKAAVSEEKKNGLKQKIEHENIKELPSNQILAKITGLTSIYGNAYRYLNNFVHANSMLLDKFLKFNQVGEITDLEWFPHFKDLTPDIKTALVTSIYLTLTGIESVMVLFNIEDEEVENITNQLNDLSIKE